MEAASMDSPAGKNDLGAQLRRINSGVELNEVPGKKKKKNGNGDKEEKMRKALQRGGREVGDGGWVGRGWGSGPVSMGAIERGGDSGK